jgi:Holliday junction DNA helicase RuvA
MIYKLVDGLFCHKSIVLAFLPNLAYTKIMIGFLSGTIHKLGSTVLVVCGGVGYDVKVGSHLFGKLTTGQPAELFIYTHVREEALALFGFATPAEKELFAMVLGVSGIGPTIALAIADRGSDALTTAVQQADVSFFTAIPRVGKKLAQKTIIELRGKLGEIEALELGPVSPEYQDVLDSLLSLGFAEQEAQHVLKDIAVAELGVAAALKIALQKLRK